VFSLFPVVGMLRKFLSRIVASHYLLIRFVCIGFEIKTDFGSVSFGFVEKK